MEKNKSYIIVGILALLVSVAAVSIAYAALNSTLEINGEATVLASSWKIKYANLAAAVVTGDAVEVTAPTINTNDTKVGDFSATLKSPGDSIKYTFDVVNDGTFDAEISSFTMPTPVCTGKSTDATKKAADETNVCNNIEYTLTYSDGTAVAVGDTLANKDAATGHTRGLILTLRLKDTMTAAELPSDDVEISNLTITTIYAQDN